MLPASDFKPAYKLYTSVVWHEGEQVSEQGDDKFTGVRADEISNVVFNVRIIVQQRFAVFLYLKQYRVEDGLKYDIK